MFPIIAATFVSLLSLLGVFFINIKNFSKYTRYLVALSAGVLISDVFVHILPEVVAVNGFKLSYSITILASILLYFILEGVIRWHHSHGEGDMESHNHDKSYVGWLNLSGSLIHNLIDGIAIGASFAISVQTGLITTFAIVLHEIPHEIGNFGVLIHAGFSRNKALWFNFATALTSILGVVLVLVFNDRIETLNPYFSVFAAGSLLYIAMADMIPEVHENEHKKTNYFTLLAFVAGMILIGSIKFFV
jgi:zinc and cadmium transporter